MISRIQCLSGATESSKQQRGGSGVSLQCSRRQCCRFCFFSTITLLIGISLVEVRFGDPAWLPLPRQLSSHAWNSSKKCPDWSALSVDESNFHTARGGLSNEDLKVALKNPKLVGKVFHLRTRCGMLHVLTSPKHCTKTPICWRRAKFFMQQVDNVLSSADMTDVNIDVLYWPWDEPMMSSLEYPVWQYNRQVPPGASRNIPDLNHMGGRGREGGEGALLYPKKNGKGVSFESGVGMLIPYSYAFSYDELIQLRKEEQVERARLQQMEDVFVSHDGTNMRGYGTLKITETNEKSNENQELRAVFRGSMSFPLDKPWFNSSRGAFCLYLDRHSDVEKWVDFGLVKMRPEHLSFPWQKKSAGCGRGVVPRMPITMQAAHYQLILDVGGGASFTDRLPNILTMKGATILQQRRRVGFADFLTPAYVRPGIHTIELRHDLSNIVSVVQNARENPETLRKISNAAERLVDERLTDHACMCAIWSNMMAQKNMHKDNGASIKTEDEQDMAAETLATNLERVLVWERWLNGGRLIVVQIRPFVRWWIIVLVLLCMLTAIRIMCRTRRSSSVQAKKV